MAFWLIAGVLALGVSAWLIWALLRARPEAGPAARFDIGVYRDQLAEVERDLARGVLSADEAERVRVEVKRRLLEADRTASAAAAPGMAPRGATRGVAVLAGLICVAGAGAVYYWALGAPGYPDMPLKKRISDAAEARATRMSQAEAEARFGRPWTPPPDADPEFLALMERLRAAVAENPGELQGQMLLARNEAMLGNFVASHRAQARAITIRGDAATADEYATLADLMVLAAQGYVSPEAEVALKKTLEMAPRHGPARYYMGLLHAQTGRPDLAFGIWQPLLGESRPDAPWLPPILSQIEQVAQAAGIDYTAPRGAGPALAGPSADDMAAAADMSPEDRQEMIRGMVERLGERLATEGGTPDEWARMIGALGVLGDTERAAAIWDEAQQVFAAEPGAVAVIRQAAESAGVAGALPGPSADDMEAAAAMSDADRQEMIRGMVDRLGERLAAEGGTPDEWARMIGALGVLGDTERAAAIWAEAQESYAGDAAALDAIRAAAQSAGVAE